MSASNQLIKKTLNENIKDELSCTQKCIILASISQDKKKILINSYDGIPLVKLYTANLKDDNFIYSKIKGALCFLYEEENNKKTYYLHIYEINYYSLLFSMQINQKMIKEMIELENNFICLPTKFHFLGFKFTSPNSMKKFLKMISCETDQDKKALDINLKGRDFKCSYKEISKVIKVVKSDFEKKFKAIDSASGKAEKEKDKNLFQRMDELYYLVNNIEYDDDNKKFNIFIDKTFNPNIIKNYIDIYKKSKNKNSLNIRIIFDDYTHIYSKKTYVDILVNNLSNNFVEAKRLITFKKEHKKRHDKEDFEESKRINSDYYITQNNKDNSNAVNTNEKVRNSAITASELKRKGNIAGHKLTEYKRDLTYKKIDSIKEVPEEDIDHLKKFNDEQDKKKHKK